jgi:hypothetical protein
LGASIPKKVGDDYFYTGMQNFLGDSNYAYGYENNPDFIAKMAYTSDQGLSEFFDYSKLDTG